MNPITVGASIILGIVLAIFAGLTLLGLMGPDSRRW
jgi:hypothetical protein